MRFALLGGHPNGVALAAALADSRRAELVLFVGPPGAAAALAARGLACERLNDLEEVLVRSDIDVVLVAEEATRRPDTLRRAVQAGKHVVCLHPADHTPIVAYEVGLMLGDTARLCLPVLPLGTSSAVLRLREVVAGGRLGTVVRIEAEFGQPPAEAGRPPSWDDHPLPQLWHALRLLGGEVRDVSAFAAADHQLSPAEPVTLSGKFEQSGVFQVAVAPRLSDRLAVFGECGRAEITWPQGQGGPAELRVSLPGGEACEPLSAEDCWQRCAREIVETLQGRPSAAPTWHDATRCLELFQAGLESVERRRVVTLVYQDFTEQTSFKGAMTAIGCALLWIVLLLLLAAPFAPWLLYFVPVFLAVFLVMQGLRWVVRAPKEPPCPGPAGDSPNPRPDETDKWRPKP